MITEHNDLDLVCKSYLGKSWEKNFKKELDVCDSLDRREVCRSNKRKRVMKKREIKEKIKSGDYFNFVEDDVYLIRCDDEVVVVDSLSERVIEVEKIEKYLENNICVREVNRVVWNDLVEYLK